MTRQELLNRARTLLSNNNVEDGALEAELLLRHTLNIDRTRFFTESDKALTSEQEADFWNKIERRVKGMPSAYITGVREFYGLEFYVDGSVLIPRPETELLVEKTIEIARNYYSPVIADIGTGCGNIAISLAVNLPHASIFTTDISQKALDTARRNCERHNVERRVRLCAGDLLEPILQPVDIIVANLPYVRTADLPAVNTNGYEPRLALDGGEDGLDVIRRLCTQVDRKLKPNGSLLLEIGMGQREEVVNLLHALFSLAPISVIPDLTGIDRVVCMTRR
ncbi:MAG TPA: peptide chain release factor N(5)-glutamine methyltransferase [Dehalococcoidales bacterium]